MDNRSQDILRKIRWDDDKTTRLAIDGRALRNRSFNSEYEGDYVRLSKCIAKNTHLTGLEVDLRGESALDITTNEFYENLEQNSTIHKLTLHCAFLNIIGSVGERILNVYWRKRNLTYLNIFGSKLDNGGDAFIAECLRSCTNLEDIRLAHCCISNEQLLPIFGAIRGLSSLERLDLSSNNIRNEVVLKTLLEDPEFNIRIINLEWNLINNDCAIMLANSLVNNTALMNLNIQQNISWSDLVARRFPLYLARYTELLCNKSNINSTYKSNHTLTFLKLTSPPIRSVNQLWRLPPHMTYFLNLNKDTNKSRVAIKKILQYHPIIDMESLYAWNLDGEWTLKSLPYVVGWFKKAKEAAAHDEETRFVDCPVSVFDVEKRKLSAIYQFSLAMPELIVPASHVRVDKKRRRGK